jgi:pimeloyl-ACP methyl ester carboxylesterase
MPTLTVNDTELYYERRGSGEPLLLIMGMSGNTVHWGEPFLAELEQSFEVIVYDHRGIGQSAAHWDPFTIRELADDAIALLDALGLESVHVCGISMGGMVAQELALEAPGRVRTLTLGCTYCGGPEAAFGTPDDLQLLGDALASGDRERALRAGFTVNVSPTYAADPAHWELFLERATTHPASVTFISLQMQAIAGHDTSERLGEISVPTLVVHGTVDRMLPASNGEVIARLISGARLELFEDVGHLFFWERPAESAALIAEHARLTDAAQ